MSSVSSPSDAALGHSVSLVLQAQCMLLCLEVDGHALCGEEERSPGVTAKGFLNRAEWSGFLSRAEWSGFFALELSHEQQQRAQAACFPPGFREVQQT